MSGYTQNGNTCERSDSDLPATRDPNSGIWDIFGGPLNYENYPYIKGHLTTIGWNQIEPVEGQFDFTRLDENIRRTISQGKRVGLIVYHGRQVPNWVYNHVGKIITDQEGDSEFPDYLDPNYAKYLYKMIDKVAHHLAAWPESEGKSLLGYIQCTVGKSGDEDGWSGNVISGRRISATEWKEWTQRTLSHYVKAYEGSGIRLMFNYASGARASNEANGYEESIEDLNFVMNIFPDAALKMGRPAHRFEMPQEQYQTEFALEYLRPRNIFTRGEMDAYFNGAYRLENEYTTNMYWNGLWTLVVGIDQWNIQPDKYTQKQHQELALGFAFVNKYAGYHHGRTSPGAWIAFRDGLDAADKERFPENIFGEYDAGASGQAKVTTSNDNRFRNILNHFAPFGARQDDPQNQYDSQVKFYSSVRGWNDVKYSIYSTKSHTRGSGNYENFMTMIDPIGSSQGRWRIGPSTHPYHRFAREFNTRHDAMRFKLDSEFASSLLEPIKVTIRYLDKGTGRWRLVYDAKTSNNKRAIAVTNTNSDTWKEVIVELQDYNFKNSGPLGSDLGLEYISGDNTVFHMIEIERSPNE